MLDVYVLLRTHTPGWNEVETSAVEITPLIGGLSNKIYVAEVAAKLLPPGAPEKAILRIFCKRAATDDAAYADFRRKENVLLRELARQELFPAVYHGFEYGRIEPFIAGSNPSIVELKTPAFFDLLAPILARLHCIEAPPAAEGFEDSEFYRTANGIVREIEAAAQRPSEGEAEPKRAPRRRSASVGRSSKMTRVEAEIADKTSWVRDAIEQDIRRLKGKVSKPPVDGAALGPVQNLAAELRWLRERHESGGRKCALAFCHNDLQEGNFLVSGAEAGARLQLIDFEYAGRNPPAYDLGNFLAECYIDNFYDEGDGFRVARELFPTDAEIAAVAARYLAALRERTRGDERFDGVALETDPGRFAGEVRLGMLCSHFFWALWGAAMAGRTDVSWNFGAYARARMGEFYRLKREWFGEQ